MAGTGLGARAYKKSSGLLAPLLTDGGLLVHLKLAGAANLCWQL